MTQHNNFVNDDEVQIQSFGKCGQGQIGVGELKKNILKPQRVQVMLKNEEISRRIVKMVLGEEFTILLTQKGQVLVAGTNKFGELGLDFKDKTHLYSFTLNTILSEKSIKITKIACGSNHTLATDTNSNVLAWGLNLKGQLGLGDQQQRNEPTVVKSISKTQEADKDYLLNSDEVVTSVACGAIHSLVLTSQKRVFAFGQGETQALGTGDNSNRLTPVLVSYLSKEGAKNVQTQNTNCLKQSNSVERLFGGMTSSGFLYDSGIQFQVGVIGNKNWKEGVNDIDGKKWPEPVRPTQRFKKICIGEFFTLGLGLDDQLQAWGQNDCLQLGITQGNNQRFIIKQAVDPMKIEVFWDGAKQITTNTNNREMEFEGLKFADIAAGSKHCLALTQKGQVQGWGKNAQFQTGQINETFKNMLIQDHMTTLSLQMSSLNASGGGDKDKEKSAAMLGCPQLVKEFSSLGAFKLFSGDNHSFVLAKTKQDFVYNEKNMLENSLNTNRKSVDDSATKTTPQGITPRDLRSKIQSVTSAEFVKNADIESLVNMNIDFAEIKIESKIAEGGQGIVYKARWRESQVAVKQIKKHSVNSKQVLEFVKELQQMEHLRHPNLVLLLGACVDKGKQCLIMEQCGRGCLWDVLHTPFHNLNWEMRRRMALQTGRGMNQLHKFTPPILHRDLKSLNLMMDESWTIKIGDFGWTRFLGDKMTSKIGTYQWMAPEVIKGEQYTEKSDVFSFGIVLWEIATRKPPYPELKGTKVAVEVVERKLRPPVPSPSSCPSDWIKLMIRCWDQDPEKRPSFKDIVLNLEQMKF